MRWVEHFSELLNPESEIDQNVLNEIQQLPIDDSLDLPITHEEVEKALKNTRLKKSPGPDGILVIVNHRLRGSNSEKLHSGNVQYFLDKRVHTSGID